MQTKTRITDVFGKLCEKDCTHKISVIDGVNASMLSLTP